MRFLSKCQRGTPDFQRVSCCSIFSFLCSSCKYLYNIVISFTFLQLSRVFQFAQYLVSIQLHNILRSYHRFVYQTFIFSRLIYKLHTFEMALLICVPPTIQLNWHFDTVSLDLTAHTNLSPIRRVFAPGYVNYKKVHSTRSRK